VPLFPRAKQDPPQAFSTPKCHSSNRRNSQEDGARLLLISFEVSARFPDHCAWLFYPEEIIIRLHSSPRFPSFGYYALEYKDPAALSIVRVLYGLSYAANKAEQTWIG
jgi:hypothetical protein